MILLIGLMLLFRGIIFLIEILHYSGGGPVSVIYRNSCLKKDRYDGLGKLQ